MKIAKCTIQRNQIEHLIHNLKALAKAYDKPSNRKHFYCHFIQAEQRRSLVDILLNRKSGLTVMLHMERK